MIPIIHNGIRIYFFNVLDNAFTSNKKNGRFHSIHVKVSRLYLFIFFFFYVFGFLLL